MSSEIDLIYKDVNEFVDRTYLKNSFIYNDPKESQQVLKEIQYHLSICDEFYFSVAFINDGGINKLKLPLKEAMERGVKGKIVTTNYLTFSDPKALTFLLNYCPNIETKMCYLTKNDKFGFHTKGYIFKEKDKYVALIGSSNITSSALTINKEWNSEIVGKEDSPVIKNILLEFNKMFNEAYPLKDIIERYKRDYEASLVIRQKIDEESKPVTKIHIFEPNSMQKSVIFRANELINSGEKRGLLISATGTGKTFASAFLTKYIEKFEVKKLLFIVHRETILGQAKNTFDLVFDDKIKSAIYSGVKKDIDDKDFIFASYSLLIKENVIDGEKKKNFERFAKDEFDLIIIDEVHRVGENHYQDIINYFKPKFLLGMSATPDRSDGYDLYSLFDHNIIYEIRLMDALDLNLLTPFNYFGIKDITVGGKILGDTSDFNLLTADERVKHILEEAEYYSYSGKRSKGLIFVSRQDIGKELSLKMNKLGKRTIFLDASSSMKEREEAIKKLESDSLNKEETLDYILTVDIFNEGVDIPGINQIILLRPTKSAIIFIQQIGRGLRKFPGKEYLVILDFIGNYKGNFNIAKALNKGKLTKGEMAKTINEVLPGEATINFDKVAKENIFNSIEKASINTKKEVYENYIDVFNRLNHIPSLIEIDKNSSLSARVFLDYKVFDSYYEFLASKEIIKDTLNEEEKAVLKFLSRTIFDGKRHLEIDVLTDLIKFGESELREEILKKDYMPLRIDEFLLTNVSGVEIALGKVDLSLKKVIISQKFKEMLNDHTFKKYLEEGISYAYYANEKYYDNLDYFKLYEKYSRFDVARIANLGRNNVSTMYGYAIKEKEGVVPIFIDYHKGKDAIQYDDHFLDNRHLIWSSRVVSNSRTTNEINKMIELLKENKIKLLIFVQKSNLKMVKDEGFYYLGEASILNPEETPKPNKDGKPCYHFLLKLEKSIPNDIYEYLTLLTDESLK